MDNPNTIEMEEFFARIEKMKQENEEYRQDIRNTLDFMKELNEDLEDKDEMIIILDNLMKTFTNPQLAVEVEQLYNENQSLEKEKQTVRRNKELLQMEMKTQLKEAERLLKMRKEVLQREIKHIDCEIADTKLKFDQRKQEIYEELQMQQTAVRAEQEHVERQQLAEQNDLKRIYRDNMQTIGELRTRLSDAKRELCEYKIRSRSNAVGDDMSNDANPE